MEFRTVPLSAVHPGPNVRRELGDLSELAASIQEVGVLEPVIVKTNGDEGWTLIAGFRRHAASIVAGREDIPILIRDSDELDALTVQVIENIQRSDLDPIDEAQAYAELATKGGFSHKEIGAKVGKNQSHVSKRIMLLDLPVKVQKAIATGSLPVEWGQLLARIEDEDTVMELFSNGNLTQWKLEAALEGQDRLKATAKLLDQAAKAGLPTLGDDERGWSPTDVVFDSVAEAKRYKFGDDERVGTYFSASGKPILRLYEPRATKGLDSSDASVRKQAEEKRTRKIERTTQERWRQAVIPVLAKPKKQETLEFALEAVIQLNLFSYAKEVCDLLDLEVLVREVPGADGKFRKERDYHETARDWAYQNQVQKLQTGMAIVVAAGRANYGQTTLGDQVESWLKQNSIPERSEVRLQVEQEFQAAESEAAAKRQAKEAKRAEGVEAGPEPEGTG